MPIECEVSGSFHLRRYGWDPTAAKRPGAGGCRGTHAKEGRRSRSHARGNGTPTTFQPPLACRPALPFRRRPCFDGQMESDVELVGRVYAQLHRATGYDHAARKAAVAAWRERHPDVSDKDAGDVVARLIVKAINDGLVWGDVK